MAVKKKKYKNMTAAEKKLNKEIRDELRKKGILPPIKSKLNRKKFAKEVREEWEKDGSIYYLPRALGCMMPSGEYDSKITPEQVGALKVMKLAIEIKKFEDDLRAKGQTEYNVVEFYEKIIVPVLNL